jgi:hypothetical protein
LVLINPTDTGGTVFCAVLLRSLMQKALLSRTRQVYELILIQRWGVFEWLIRKRPSGGFTLF